MNTKPVLKDNEISNHDDDDVVTEHVTANFHAFMLRGKSKETTSVTTTTSALSTTTTPPLASKTKQGATWTSIPTTRTHHNNYKSKSLRPIVKAFQGRLQDWNHADTNSEKVLRSIGNLQMRLAYESHHYQYHHQRKQQHQNSLPKHQQPWIGWGFRPTAAAVTGALLLTPQDINMALDHDLLQHERMLASLRSLIASMAQSLDAVSRRLEEWMNICWNNVGHHHNCQQQQQQQQQRQPMLEDAMQLYRLLAQDLYRKQVAIQRVLESSGQDRWFDFDALSSVADGATPQEISKEALKEWTSSPIQKEKDTLMRRFLQNCEMT
jgi:hypothetical protein